MPTATTTLVFRVDMAPDTEAVVRTFAEQSARWCRGVFGQWYADFRATRGEPSRSKYAGLVSPKRISGVATGKPGGRDKYRVNVQGKAPNLYSMFLTRGRRVEPAVPTGGVKNSALHGSLSHLGTVVDGFLDRDLRRSRCHDRRILRRRREARARKYGSAPDDWDPPNFYPRMRPVARFQHGLVRWVMTEGTETPVGIVVAHPMLGSTGRLTITIPPSDDPRYSARLSRIGKVYAAGKRLGVEFHHHADGGMVEGWYAHVAVPIDAKDPDAEVERVMGIDVGERNIATTAILGGPNPGTDRVGAPILYHGLSTRHRLEMAKDRVRKLRGMTDRNESRYAAEALDRAKGKSHRVLHTLIHQVSADVVARAVDNGVAGIAMEDLSRFQPALRNPGKKPLTHRVGGPGGHKLRRLLSRWNRGELQHAVAYKAAISGIRIAGPRGTGIYPALTSLRCPKCGVVDMKARRNREFTCAQVGCGYRDNDDVTGALNIASRGYGYFHASTRLRPPANPPGEPVGVSTLGDPPPSSTGDGGGASSMPSATAGGAGGSPSQAPENPENGAGSAVVGGYSPTNRLRPTGGDARGIDRRHTNHSDKGGSALAPDAASGEEVTRSPDTARRAKPRRRRAVAAPETATDVGRKVEALENGASP